MADGALQAQIHAATAYTTITRGVIDWLRQQRHSLTVYEIPFRRL